MTFFNHKNLMLLAIFILVFTYCLDSLVFGLPFLYDVKPQFDTHYLFRSLLVFIASACLILATTSASNENNRPNSKTIQQKSSGNIWRVWGNFEGSINNHHIILNRSKLLVFLLALSSCFFVLLFLHSPHSFSLISLEDGLVEVASAILSAINSLIFLAISWRVSQTRHAQKRLVMSTSLIFSAIFFMITMEEISWFERIFDLSVSPIFSDNAQLEMNLHNFATDESELFYYMGSFVFLILLPFIYQQNPHLKINSSLSFFIPSPFIILCSSIFIAYNYDMWNNLFIQCSFFCTLTILFFYLYQELKDNQEVELLSILMALLFIQQLLFLVFGENLKRLWELTEYKEFYISLAFFIYSIEMLRKSKALS